ncbi:MAG: DnaK suppressor protein [Pseudomonadota bacterium]|jgi:DnaK suppressor protein|nr:DnaK suppressor protein [Pseudomonadota bacterium]
MPAAKRPASKAKTSAKTKPGSSAARTRVATRKTASKAARTPVRDKAKPAAKSAPKPAKKKVATKPAKAPAANRGTAKKAPGVAPARSAAKTGNRKAGASTGFRSSQPRPESYEYDPDALIHGIRPYKPKAGESYMNAAQLEHFRQVLLAWKRELMEEVDRTVHHMQDEASNFPDPNDRATQESEFGLELRTRDRERKLLKKIASALARIDDNSYGYCEETGEEIGLKRLEARPVATLCLEAQERRELAEKQYGERDDRHR